MNTEKFLLKNPRIKELRENVLSKKPAVCIERARHYTEAYKKFEGHPLYIQRAEAIANVLDNMKIYIKSQELIVGNQAEDERTAPIFPEYAVDWIITELNEKGNFNQRQGDNFFLPEEYKQELLDICQYWRGKTLKDKCTAAMPESIRAASGVKAVHGEGNMTSGDGHIVPDFEKILRLGIGGIIKITEAELAGLDIAENDALRKQAFWQSIIITMLATKRFIGRYAALARAMAKQSKDDARIAELLQIAANCEWIADNPPRTFHEATQLVWFAHLVIQIESNGHSASLGRLDQYLYSYYARDIAADKLTQYEAKELLQCLWIKLFSILKIRPTSHAGYGAGYPTYQNVTIGGMDSLHNDGVNDLSMLILESVAECKLTQPNLSARVHNYCSERFLRLCAEVIALGYGMPALHNDEIIVPALLNKGVQYEDAYNYTQVGCVEVAVPGKWGYRCTGMSFLNIPKVVELTLNNGFDERTGSILFASGKTLPEFSDYNELWQAFSENMAYYTKLSVALDKLADVHLEQYPDIFCSALVDDCIKRGKTAKEGGAVYDIIAGLQVGLANAANSFAALKKVVYEDQTYTAAQVQAALKSDFSGIEGMKIRRALLEVPKFGNDVAYVDEIALNVYNVYINEIAKYTNTRHGRGPIGGNYGLSTSGISSNVPMGVVTAATPDGRKAWTPVAEGVSPTQGSDVNGATSALKSVIKLPTLLFTGGQLLNQKFSPEFVNNPQLFEKFISFIKAFIALRGWHIQFNIISVETLKAAQRDPEKYRDIIVRVAGYCAQFVTLDKITQDDIIARTEQKL
ncbi:MAG: glycyl radical protein [Negativicutes bacterium]|jgi:formate C-acetyltransferase